MKEETVLEAWEMCCPECGSDEGIHICAFVWVALSPDGTSDACYDHEWDDTNPCCCHACDYSGLVKDFEEAAKRKENAE